MRLVRIAAYSDHDHDESRRPLWGDYWVQRYLLEAFSSLGFRAESESPDLLVHLFGTPMPELPKARARALWIHSHPDRLTREIIGRYDVLFSASRLFAERLRRDGVMAEYLPPPTHMKPLDPPKSRDVVFVGNNRRNGRRKLMSDLLSIRSGLTCRVEIWGDGWEGVVPPEWLRGRYFPNEELNALYSSARIVLNDHHDDMAREGFLNPRIIDAVAAGALPVTDEVAGLNGLGNIPVYRRADELARMIGFYLENDIAARAIVEQARNKTAGWTYQRAAEVIAEYFG
jgi:hypothetical protein